MMTRTPDVSLWGVYAVRPARLAAGRACRPLLPRLRERPGGLRPGDGPGAPPFARGPHLGAGRCPGSTTANTSGSSAASGSGDIDAWTAANAVRYNFQGLPLQPAVRRAIRRRQRRPQPALAEPPDVQPALPLRRLLQPREPHRPAEYHRPPSRPRPQLRRGGDGDRGLEFLLAGEPGRRHLQPGRRPPPAGDSEPGPLYRELPLDHRGMEGHASHSPSWRAMSISSPARTCRRIRRPRTSITSPSGSIYTF